MDEDLPADIEDLEAHIEALAESIERCRKISFASKLLIGAGTLWLCLLLIGLVTFAPYALVAALAAIIGGIVLVGSNATTWEQTQAALRRAEAQRAEMIAHMPLRVVGGDTQTLH
jgi:hypothetical protein